MLNTDLRVAIISFYESWKGLKLRIGIDQTQIQTKEQKNHQITKKSRENEIIAEFGYFFKCEPRIFTNKSGNIILYCKIW